MQTDERAKYHKVRYPSGSVAVDPAGYEEGGQTYPGWSATCQYKTEATARLPYCVAEVSRGHGRFGAITPINRRSERYEVGKMDLVLMTGEQQNVVLGILDKELEHRGFRFVRYGGNCNIYVKSEGVVSPCW